MMKRRYLALVLTAAMLLGMLPMLNAASAEADGPVVSVLQDGKSVSSITVPRDGETFLTGVVSGAVAHSLQWQIHVPGTDTWVNIDGYTSAECPVSYALVGSLMDAGGTACLRLSAVVSGCAYTSQSVTVTVTEPQPSEQTPEPVYAQTPEARVLDPVASAKGRSGAARASTPGGSTATWDVVVEFLYPDGTAAIQPFMAKIGDGEELIREIVFAPIAGYAPYFDSDQDGVLDVDDVQLTVGDDGNYHFDVELMAVTRTEIFHIRFRPVEVGYKVEHYVQGMDNRYTLMQTDVKTGLTNDLVPAGLALTGGVATGHTAQEYARIAIAADGQTVVRIYYLINYYMVDFALEDGAYGVVPVYVRYGTTVTVGRPTRPGYSFAGWELVEVNGVEAAAAQKQTHMLTANASGSTYTVSAPAANLKYRAMWSTGATSYTVVYWRETETAVGYTGETKYEYWGSETVGGTYGEDGQLYLNNSVTPGVAVELSRYTTIPSSLAVTNDESNLDESYFFHYNEEKTTAENPGTITVAGDGTSVINVYFDRNEYTLKFYYAARNGSNYYVFGRTNYFGTDSRSSTNRNDEISLLNGVWSDSFEYNVDAIPEVLGYEPKEEVSGSYTYYYFTFQAKYGADISECWPTTSNFSSLPGGYNNKDIVFSAWNGEYNVQYTQTELALNKDNETIKGQYRRLDYRVLWSTERLENETVAAAYNNTVSYLAYWCNAATRSSASWNVPSLYRYNIYLECLEQHSADTTCKLCEGKAPRAFEGKTYYRVAVYDVADNQDTSNGTSTRGNLQKQTHPDVYGFTNVNDANGTGFSQNAEFTNMTAGQGEDQYDSGIYQSGYEVYHFYDRVRYNLEFYNMGEKLRLLDANGQYMDYQSIRYGVSLYDPDGYDISEITGPDGKSYYPDSLPENAYEFEGWYTSATFAASTKFDFAEYPTMPAANLVLYAHWVPKQFKVRIFRDEASKLANDPLWSTVEADGTVRDYTMVAYGERAPTPSEQYEDYGNDKVHFVGWFYRDANGTETAWNFDSMPVTHDVDIYGKWTSNQVKTYTVNYVLKDADGNVTTTHVAEPLTGSELVGGNITLIAKAGTQLYAAYRENYFLEGETSNTLQISEDDAENTYTFYYVQATSVPYTVRYVDQDNNPIMLEDGTPVEDKVVSTNPYSIVTEVFRVIPGYLPDAYSKRLVVSVDEDGVPNAEENIITFVYAENDTQAYYRVEHYVQAEAGEGYILYQESQTIGYIGDEIPVELLQMTGFNYVPDKTAVTANGVAASYTTEGNTVTAELTESGLLFQFYYDRQLLTYTVRYLEDETETVLASPKTVTVRYGVSVTEQGIDIRGYELITVQANTQTITENIEMVFHYRVANTTLHYVAKGQGFLSTYSEPVIMVGGTAIGSEPTPNGGYHFVGWYENEACTLPVNASWVDNDGKLTPRAVDGYFEETTYYALFERNTADLTISTDFPVNNTYRQTDGSQTFIFRITGTGTTNTHIQITIALHERESKTIADLPTGTYSVEELSSSGWRYNADASSKTVEVRPNQANGVSFLETRAQTLWLDGNAAKAVNSFTPVTSRKREGDA